MYVSKYEIEAGTQARVKSRQTILPGGWERIVDVSRLGGIDRLYTGYLAAA